MNGTLHLNESTMTPLELRPAQAGDCLNLHAVCREVWPEEGIQAGHIQEALLDPQHAAAIAVKDGRVAGFVDGFVTTSAAGLRRWEVDLLGVVPGQRGQGIGRQLVLASLDQAKAFRPQFARALIRTDNTASQHAFKGTGFIEDGAALDLYCARNPSHGPTGLPAGAALIPVQTFSYRGCWLEGELSDGAFMAARSSLAGGGDLAGALIEREDTSGRRAAVDAGFTFVDTYRWWVYSWQGSADEGP